MNTVPAKKKRRLPKTAEETRVQIALGTLEIDTVLSMLRSKKTPSDVIEVLDSISYDDNLLDGDAWKVLQRYELIAKHPNTPSSVLETIFHRDKFMEEPRGIRHVGAHVLRHPSFPVKLLREVFYALAHDSQFDTYYTCLFEAIANPNTPADWLEVLAKHKNDTIRVQVAEHLNTPPKVLELLSTDAGNDGPYHSSWLEPWARVASNPHTPSRVLETMSTSSNSIVRKRIAANPTTPVSTLKTMVANDKSTKIRSTALYTLFARGKIIIEDS